jgi:putative intracellular protease/amidase
METKNFKNRLLAFLALTVMFAMVGYGITDPGVPRAPKAVKALLLMDELYGASVNIEDNQNNILENFASYGWEVTIACCSQEVNPCPWAGLQGCEVLQPDMMTYRLDNALEWDVIVVAPGGSHLQLMNCPFVLNVLEQAKKNNIPIAAWCRGVRLLAEADVINGVSITGHADYEDEYLAAGADYLGNWEPPTADQNVVTCVNATEYRQEMCELIKEVVESTTSVSENRARKNDRMEFKLYPNPISSTSAIEFSLEKPSVVHVAIFDQQGNMVMDVVKHPFPEGENSLSFSPTKLPTGIYYVYLFCEGKMGMKKCMII